ncbi:hypothetical protein GLOTRDRAFT_134604 [Gloeophyllum trabeum ATCC 11539]|uniref:Uncharacterized protein n=1 Tax=Gloeophyllum trabeum (strain ATCC 11539 / FP-39264 / Madison 617) TaxID=670483 RepID=S7PPJ4_GLOTA|nr:uncharacterized protein GLOTRDRAFT_134604 [Gloeophyllum trabeum ATCC 11539]EPQ49791.1 hypothetical protein GLOTRDRAFT_134604 [Gloeophyllum trabeum ATCC 11539]
MYKHNDTELFMDLMFLDEDHTFIMKEARKKIDSSKLEAKWCQAQVEHEKELKHIKKQKAAEKCRKLEEKKAHLASVVLVFSDEAVLSKLSIKQLDEQIEVYCKCDKLVPKKSHAKNKSEKISAMKKELDSYLICFPQSKGLWLEDNSISVLDSDEEGEVEDLPGDAAETDSEEDE